jgi:hypothetical protein
MLIVILAGTSPSLDEKAWRVQKAHRSGSSPDTVTDGDPARGACQMLNIVSENLSHFRGSLSIPTGRQAFLVLRAGPFSIFRKK